MGSESPLKLPIIDLSELKPGGPEWDSVKLQVKEAMEQYGCFEAVYDKVPVELHKALYTSLQELFDLPLPTKIRNKSAKHYHGYVGQYPSIPLYESMGIEGATHFEKVESFTNMLWPEGNASFCKAVTSFSNQVAELDKMVRRMVLESLGVEKYYDEHNESTNYLVRLMKYKGPQTNDTKLGLNPHTDKNIMTILTQNQVNGLEVQTKDGGTWIDVNISPNSFVVMFGDAFMAWTNGRSHSPVHRVMMTGNEARYSAGLFSVPNAGYIIKAPEELVDEEHPLLFKPFDHVEFLNFYYTAEGEKRKSDLKTYCGV